MLLRSRCCTARLWRHSDGKATASKISTSHSGRRKCRLFRSISISTLLYGAGHRQPSAEQRDQVVEQQQRNGGAQRQPK